MPIIGAANAGPLAFKHKMQQQMYHHYFPAVVVTNHRLSIALKIIMRVQCYGTAFLAHTANTAQLRTCSHTVFIHYKPHEID